DRRKYLLPVITITDSGRDHLILRYTAPILDRKPLPSAHFLDKCPQGYVVIAAHDLGPHDGRFEIYALSGDQCITYHTCLPGRDFPDPSEIVGTPQGECLALSLAEQIHLTLPQQ